MRFIRTLVLKSNLSRYRFVQGGALAILLAAGLSLALPLSATPRNGIETVSGAHSELSEVHVQTTATGWSISGQLRLLPHPLRHSNPGRVVLKAVAPDGQILAASDATIYRVVTANPRARLFGFRGELSDGFSAGTTLHVHHLPADL